jgi:hypothetical protein
VSVTPADLQITAASAASIYGSAVVAIAPSYSAFAGNDTAADLISQPSCSTDALATSVVGSYDTDCSGATDSNYTISYTSGGYDVTAAPLSVTASSLAFVRGTAEPAVTASYAGFVNGDAATALATPATCADAASSTSTPGTYATSCSGVVDTNYDVLYVNGVATVEAAPVVSGGTAADSTGTLEQGDGTSGAGSSTAKSHSKSGSKSTSGGNASGSTPAPRASGSLGDPFTANPVLGIGLILLIIVLLGGGALFWVRRRS